MQLRESQIAPPISELKLDGEIVEKESGRYTWEKKYSVVTTYLACGNMRLTAKKCGVSAPTIESWRKTSWWADAVAEVRNTEAATKDSKLNKLINKSLEIIEDRLENGEQVLNQKTGQLEHRPVALRDVIRVTSDLMQRQKDLHEMQTNQEVGKQTTQEILKALAKEFENFNKLKSPQAEDIPFVEVVSSAVHDERETGLQ